MYTPHMTFDQFIKKTKDMGYPRAKNCIVFCYPCL